MCRSSQVLQARHSGATGADALSADEMDEEGCESIAHRLTLNVTQLRETRFAEELYISWRAFEMSPLSGSLLVRRSSPRADALGYVNDAAPRLQPPAHHPALRATVSRRERAMQRAAWVWVGSLVAWLEQGARFVS